MYSGGLSDHPPVPEKAMDDSASGRVILGQHVFQHSFCGQSLYVFQLLRKTGGTASDDAGRSPAEIEFERSGK